MGWQISQSDHLHIQDGIILIGWDKVEILILLSKLTKLYVFEDFFLESEREAKYSVEEIIYLKW